MEGEEECQPVPHHRAAVSDTTDAAGWGRGGGGRGWASLGPGLGLGLQQRLSLGPCLGLGLCLEAGLSRREFLFAWKFPTKHSRNLLFFQQ